jgi:hypothetical protein
MLRADYHQVNTSRQKMLPEIVIKSVGKRHEMELQPSALFP